AEVPTRIGGPELASGPYAACNVPAALHFEAARNCAVEGCSIIHVGGYGIELADSCRSNLIAANELIDLGAGGVKVGGANRQGPASRVTEANVISDNDIAAGGRVFHSGVGILLTHACANEVVHNHIHDLYYSGISCGWIWGYADNVSRDNHIEKNLIHDVGQGFLSDLAGIYILGVQPGTVIRGNVVHDVRHRNY